MERTDSEVREIFFYIMFMPKVSVVIPTCNRPDLLSQAIQSVLMQTFQDFEIIVVDDGTESVAQAVESFKDSRIRYIKNIGVHGGGAARNLGIKEAKGDFIAFLDDDDEWLPEKLSIQMQRMVDTPSEVGCCVSGARIISESDEHINHVEDGVHDFADIVLTRFKGFLTSTLIVKREVFSSVGFFDESLPSHQEAELLIRITRKYKGFGINKPLTIMNMLPHEHIGGDIYRRIRGKEMVLEKHTALFAAHPGKLAKQYFWLALWCRDAGERTKARHYFLRAFQLSGNPRYCIHWLLAR